MKRQPISEEELAEMQQKVNRGRGQQGKHLPLSGANDGPVPNKTGNTVRNPRMARNKGRAPVSLRGRSVEALGRAGRGEAYSPEAGQTTQLRTKESERRTNAGARPAPSPLTLTLTGQLPGGKNQVQLSFRHVKVHRYPNKTFENWRAKAFTQIMEQADWGRRTIIRVPVRLTVGYTPGDARTRDVSGQLDAIFHLLVYAKVLKDDGLIHELGGWTRHAINRKAPKVELTIEEVPHVKI